MSEQKSISKELADIYQPFFNFLQQEHGLLCTVSEMDEIISEVEKHKSRLRAWANNPLNM